ncbi:TIGR01777 family oxidoreductase [Pyruvatibacter sp.]|uniref:TIGR01777 family oxidoreductase n=1 Tax=Pyruvatibacter sp. TaxID=1981328 RepID=UPI0032EC0987
MSKERIAIIGATGLVGRTLYDIVDKSLYEIAVIGRSVKKLRAIFPDAIDHMNWDGFKESEAKNYSAIVNLAGSGVSEQKWTNAYKQEMCDSRIGATEICVDLCARNSDIHLINASAVSAYGFYTEPFIRFTEDNTDARKGIAFLQSLIDVWEETALLAENTGNSVALLRTGVVFDASEGPLPQIMKPFKMFVGGKIGSGRQMMSWISLEDEARAINFLLANRHITGPINCTSPGACTNAEFAKALGKALRKPSFFPTPALIIRATMGQMGDELIVKGQHVFPKKLLDSGFQFKHETINAYLSDAVAR